MRIARWIAAAVAVLSLSGTAACSSTTTSTPPPATVSAEIRHDGNVWSNLQFIAAAKLLGYPSGTTTYDEGSQHWSMVVQIGGCAVELDQTAADKMAIEVDRVGKDDGITAAKLGRVGGLTGITYGQLEEAFVKSAVQTKVPCAKGFTRPRR